VAVDESSSTSEALLNNLRDLVRCVDNFSFWLDQRVNRFPDRRRLSEITRFAQKEASRGLVMKVIRHKSDLDTINQYREDLRQSLNLFKVRWCSSYRMYVDCHALTVWDM